MTPSERQKYSETRSSRSSPTKKIKMTTLKMARLTSRKFSSKTKYRRTVLLSTSWWSNYWEITRAKRSYLMSQSPILMTSLKKLKRYRTRLPINSKSFIAPSSKLNSQTRQLWKISMKKLLNNLRKIPNFIQKWLRRKWKITAKCKKILKNVWERPICFWKKKMRNQINWNIQEIYKSSNHLMKERQKLSDTSKP